MTLAVQTVQGKESREAQIEREIEAAVAKSLSNGDKRSVDELYYLNQERAVALRQAGSGLFRRFRAARVG